MHPYLKVLSIVGILLASTIVVGIAFSREAQGNMDYGGWNDARKSSGVSKALDLTAETDRHRFTFESADGTVSFSLYAQLTAGQVGIVVKDPSGKAVARESYTGPARVADSGRFTGAPGTWTLEVTLVAATGQVVLSAQG